MNKALLLGAALLTAGTALADWGTTNANPVEIFPEGTTSYATRVCAGNDGSVWAMIYHPNTKEAAGEEDIQNVVYEFRLQHFDEKGNPTFPEEGILLSDYANLSYTVVTDYLMVDSDGNAIVAVPDCRNSGTSQKSINVYKVNPEGEMLWGDDGIALSDPLKPSDLISCINLIELEDGSYVFAWQEINGNQPAIYLQRLNHDGKAQWDLEKMALTSEYTSYPYLVNSGDNTCILVYARTASQILTARKLDFEGENVWGKDTRIYRGGFGQTPIHTQVKVYPSGDGGALVCWNDDREGTKIESAYISYVTSDGKLAFAGTSDEGDCKLCYDGWRCFNVRAVPAADGSGFYAIWRRTNSNQQLQGVMMQKVSLEGELLWGDEAKELCPTAEYSIGYISVQAAGESDACGFYEIYNDYYDQQCFASRFDKEGAMVWENPVAISTSGRKATDLESQPYGSDAWLCNWEDGGTSSDDKGSTYLMTRLNIDGTFGIPGTGIASAASDAATLAFRAGSLRASVADGTSASVYNASGAKVAEANFRAGVANLNLPAGFYIAKTSDGRSLKFFVK